MTHDKTAGWYAGSSDDRFECGPHETRDDAIAEVIIQEAYDAFEEDGKWKAWIFYAECGDSHFECDECGTVPKPCDDCAYHLDTWDLELTFGWLRNAGSILIDDLDNNEFVRTEAKE